jgi:hypothetical protein
MKKLFAHSVVFLYPIVVVLIIGALFGVASTVHRLATLATTQEKLDDLTESYERVSDAREDATTTLEKLKKEHRKSLTRKAQLASNAVQIEGIKEFYRGWYVQCLLNKGMVQGVTPPLEELVACDAEVTGQMAVNLHTFTFPAPPNMLPIPETFDMSRPVPRPIIPLLPFQVPDETDPDPNSKRNEGIHNGTTSRNQTSVLGY